MQKMFFIAAAVAALATPQWAQAQTIQYETKVAGYSNSGNGGWILVKAGVNTGGRVTNAGRRDAFTDRVKRGEPLRVTITEQGNPACEVAETIVGVVADNGFVRAAPVKLPFTGTFEVGGNPSLDNVTAVVLNKKTGKVVTRRVPIGTRP